MTSLFTPSTADKKPLSARIVDRLSALGGKHSRRGFFTRAAVVGSAMAMDPVSYVLKPGTAYAQTTCGPGALCGEGWSVFCCTINNGKNACPPGSFVAGWWKADSSAFCGGAPRYYIDCNQMCGHACTCYCPTGTCDNRRTCCNHFRYGQCHQEIECYGPVVCRMVMCSTPWDYDEACTTTSATDNRTSTHNAPCNTEVPYYEVEPPVASATWLIDNRDGRLELIHVGSDGSMWNRWQNQPGGSFAGSGHVGGAFPLGAETVLGRNADGRLEVFAVAANGNLHHSWQRPDQTWSPVASLGGWIVAPVGVGSNADGRLEVFAIAITGELYHLYQLAPNAAWGGWESLGGLQVASPPAVARNEDGRMAVFVIGADGQFWHRYQRAPNASWSGWETTGGSYRPLRPAVLPYKDGRLHLACVGTDNAVHHFAQVAPNAPFSPASSLGGSTTEAVALGTNADGRHEVFAVDVSGALQHNWEWTPGSNYAGWGSMGSSIARRIATASNEDGRITVICVGNNHAISTTSQTTPNGIWSPLTSIGGYVS